MMKIGTANTADLMWDKVLRVLHGYSEMFGRNFPQQIVVKSHHTGRELIFAPVQPGHPMFDEDGWDGEQAIYEVNGAAGTALLAAGAGRGAMTRILACGRAAPQAVMPRSGA